MSSLIKINNYFDLVDYKLFFIINNNNFYNYCNFMFNLIKISN